MDRLDQLIETKQAELEATAQDIARCTQDMERFTQRHDRLRIELEALKQAAQIRPPKVNQTHSNGTAAQPTKKRRGKRGGRQAGDISHEWRQVLAHLWKEKRRVSYNGVHEAASANGINTKMPNIRERVRAMLENGLLSGTPARGFFVTEAAVARFGLDKMGSPSAGADAA